MDENEEHVMLVDGPRLSRSDDARVRRVELLHGHDRDRDDGDESESESESEMRSIARDCQRAHARSIATNGVDWNNACNACCPYPAQAVNWLKRELGWGRIHFCICIASGLPLLTLITTVAWAVVSEEEREEAAAASDGAPGGVHATMISLTFTSNWTDAVAGLGAQFILEEKDGGNYVMFSASRSGQRVDVWSRATGNLVTSLLNHDRILVNPFCNEVEGLDTSEVFTIGQYYTCAGTEHVPIYFDADKWVMRELPEALYINPLEWPVRTDRCLHADVTNIIENQDADSRWYAKDEDGARRRFRFVWRLTHAHMPESYVEQRWHEFWQAYLPYHYDDISKFFTATSDKHSQHSGATDRADSEQAGVHAVRLADRLELGDFAINCGRIPDEWDALKGRCADMYTCNGIGMHAIPQDFQWSCECALSLSGRLLSGVFCPPATLDCLLVQYAFARIWEFVPCSSTVRCHTDYVDLPVGVSERGLITTQSVRTSYDCIEVYTGGLSAFKGL